MSFKNLKIDPEKLKLLKRESVSEMLNLATSIHKDLTENRWEQYRPLEKQKRFHQSMAQTRAFIGGNRSGKTTAGIVEALWYAMGRHPWRNVLAPNHGWIVALDNDVMHDVILPKLWEYLPEKWIKRFNQVKGILELTNGSIIKLKSCDSGAEKFQSAECRWIWFDEEPPQDVWSESTVRAGALYPLDMWITMTPLNGMDWSWDEIVCKQAPGKVEVITANLADNHYLLASEIKRLEESFAGKSDEGARLRGEYFHRSGLVYKGLMEERHLIDPFPIPKDWPWVRAIDPHPRKPSVAVWAALSPENVLYVVDELCDPHEMLFSEFASKVKEIDGERRIVRSLIDPASLQTNMGTGKSMKQHIADAGVPTILANNDRNYGYDCVRSRIAGVEGRGPTLLIFRTCPTLWRQLTHLVYEEWKFRASERDPKEVQRKRDDDLADALRYVCASGIVWEDDQEAQLALATQEKIGYTGYNRGRA